MSPMAGLRDTAAFLASCASSCDESSGVPPRESAAHSWLFLPRAFCALMTRMYLLRGTRGSGWSLPVASSTASSLRHPG